MEEVTQQAQQAYTQKDLQLYEKNAQNAQLRQKIDELQQKMRNRGLFESLFETSIDSE